MAPVGTIIPADTMAAASVRVEDVDLSYGSTRVLKGITLDIQPGELFSFLGPSGCGKTTLLRLIAGFARADRGRITIAGKDISALPPWQRDVGMVFQSYALWPHMTVARNVAFGLEERRLPQAEVASRVSAALELVGLQELGQRRPSELSGGQQQRVALARTIVVRPKVLLLDEPLSNLDARLRLDVRRELRSLQRRLGITTIFVTHDQEEANTISDRIAVMHDGIVQQVGAPRDVYERPANLFVAKFLGAANVLPGRLVGAGRALGYEVTGGGQVLLGDAAPPDGAQLVCRPHAVALTDAPSPAGTDLSLDGEIMHREYLGVSMRYAVRVGDNEILADVGLRPDTRILEPGDRVTLSIPHDSMVWVKA